jgi:predicted Zn-dependent protease
MNENGYILIERYLQGELKEEQQLAFQARLKAEPLFASALTERQQLNDHLRAVVGEEKLQPTLAMLGDKYFQEETKEAKVRTLGGTRRWLYGIAAAAALAIMFAGPWLFPSSGGYEQFAQHDPLSLTERGTPGSPAAATETAFNNGRYASAIGLLEEYLTIQSDDERARLALGISLLETDKDDEAIKVFTAIVDGVSTLAPYGNWYLAFAAVKRGDNEKAEEYLELIPSSDTYLTAKAKELRATF